MHSFVAIELLTFCKNAKKLFYCSRELQYPVRNQDWFFLLFVYKFNCLFLQLKWDKYEVKFIDIDVSSLTAHNVESLCLKQFRSEFSSRVDICRSRTAMFSLTGHDADLIARHGSQ